MSRKNARKKDDFVGAKRRVLCVHAKSLEGWRGNEVLASIRKSLSELHRESLGMRKRFYKDRAYEYHYLKFREGNKIVNHHVSKGNLKDMQNKLAQRKKYEKEAQVCERRFSYLKKLLKTKGRPGGSV